MKIKKIIALGLAVALFSVNVTAVDEALAEGKNEVSSTAKTNSKEGELDLVMAGDVLLHLRLAYWSDNGKGG